ncbi:MAG TPA: lipopolysaccharide kinase InaA family protein, partial [Pseudomonadales bacterium]|nr:lipopolysaccharide kinase InaA family protein [Pseudomonadales bacterium]
MTQITPLQTLAMLQNSGRDISLPFRIALPDGSALLCTDMLRLLPGKRMVMRAEYNGKTVLAKLFFDSRNLQQERGGYTLLHQTGVATPTLLAEHRLEQGGICLYQFIENAESLDVLWQQSGATKKILLLDTLLATLQTCYQQQVLQQDLHLGNFLLQGDTLIVLDPASCRTFSGNAQQDNLALLLAQLPFADWQPTQEKILAFFPTATSNLAKQAQQCWQQRQQDYLQKIFRDCSDVADLSANSLHILCRRQALTYALATRLREPQSLINNATILKDGNSAKVFLTEIDGKKLVVKQYINKDWLRKIRRAFRPSRAARSWYFSHAFSFAGIRVPAPVALIEQKSGPFVTSAWFICEYSDGKDLLSCWQEHEPYVEELSSIHALFLSLQLIHSSHGDMKASNLLSDGANISLIDYDGAQEHRSPSALTRALAEDKQRFLQNWADNTTLQK